MALWIDTHHEEEDIYLRPVVAEDSTTGYGGGSMSTAIVIIETSEGFVIAGDGKSEDSLDTQKVFPIPHTFGNSLAYGLSGYAGGEDTEIGLDLNLTTFLNRAFICVSSGTHGSLDGFASAVSGLAMGLFREAINEAFSAEKITAVEQSKLLNQPDPSRIYVCGYFNGAPVTVLWDFVFGGQWSHGPSERPDQVGRSGSGKPIFYGSSIVRTCLKTKSGTKCCICGGCTRH